VRKFQSSWKTGQSPLVKKVYKVVENADFLVRYDKYLCVFFRREPISGRSISISERHMAMSVSAIMERNAAVGLEMMAIRRCATRRHAQPVQFSRHRSKSSSPDLVERKPSLDIMCNVLRTHLNVCIRFGAGVYTSTASNKYPSSLGISS
jgi:hypothetical protein